MRIPQAGQNMINARIRIFLLVLELSADDIDILKYNDRVTRLVLSLYNILDIL